MGKSEKTRRRNADKVTMRPSPNAGSVENQNQGHSAKKEALGPNTKR
jgi:hypothetical protein